MMRIHPNCLVNSRDPVYSINNMNSCEAAMILFDPFWDFADYARKYIQGDPIVAIPARDMLFFTDSSSQLGIATIQKIIEKVFAMPDGDLLTKSLLIRNDSNWHEYNV